jgi:phosphoribosyl 1,2-cyclic phosphate phosphodiesterase
MLYGHDTGRFPEATFDFLAGTRLDVATFDCTFGPTEDLDYHMGFYGAVKVRDELAARGCVDAATKTVVTHFSHNGKLMHDEYVALAAPYGFLVAYDGMVLEV